MTLGTLARFAYRAVRWPAPALAPRVGRALLLQRRVFDLVSLVMQARDAGRVGRIARAYTSDEPYVRRVHDYNSGVTVTKGVTTTRRAELLYRVAALPPRVLAGERLLIVGPRNVQELLIAWLHGFRWRDIQAIDLYSTNPKIAVMNMEEMTFPDASFDVIVMSNTLAYASDTAKCLAEMARVLRPGGRLVFGATYDPGDDRWLGSAVSGDQIVTMLRKVGLEIYHYEPTDKVNSLGRQQTSHLFGCAKPDPTRPGFDRIRW